MTESWLVVRIIAFIAGVFGVVSSFELLDIRDMYGEKGLMSRKVVRLHLNSIPLSKPLRPILTRFTLVLLVRIPLGLSLAALAVVGYVHPGVVLLLFGTDLLIQLRHTGGLSGAFDMGLVTNGGLLVATLFPSSEFITTAAILFIAAQGLLSYFIAGIAKLLGEEWRDGTAIEMIFSTESWGDDRVYELTERYPQTKLLGSWTVIGFECLFPLVLFVDSQFVGAFFAVGILFHVANAVLMGINSFVLIFPATYPAIFHANEFLRTAVL